MAAALLIAIKVIAIAVAMMAIMLIITRFIAVAIIIIDFTIIAIIIVAAAIFILSFEIIIKVQAIIMATIKQFTITTITIVMQFINFRLFPKVEEFTWEVFAFVTTACELEMRREGIAIRVKDSNAAINTPV